MVAVLWIALVGTSLCLILREPWLGLNLLPTSGNTIVVSRATGPSSEALPAGTVITALRGLDGEWLKLTAGDLNPEPTYLDTYAELNHFFHRQGLIRAALGAPVVEFQTESGATASIAPEARRPVQSVSAHVWVQFGFAAVLLLVSGAALARDPREIAAWIWLLTAIGMINCYCAHAVYSARELAISAESFRFLIGFNHWSGIALAAGGGGSIPAFLPRRFSPRYLAWVIPSIGLVMATAGEFRWAPNITLGFRVPMTVLFGCGVVLSILQWRRSVGRPVDRAMLRWWMVPAFVTIAMYYLLVVLPSSVGRGPYVSQTWGWAITTLFYGGIGLGVARFRLFYVNPVNLLIWGITGAICAVAVTLLRTILVDQWLASCLGIAAAGIIYFPARDLIWRKQPGQHARMETALESIAARAVGTRSLADVMNSWRAVLQDIFLPVEIERLRATSRDAVLVDEATMDVSLRAPEVGMRLLRPFAGRGLFSPHDIELAKTVGTLFSALIEYWNLHARGEREERSRIAEMLRKRLSFRLQALRARVDTPELVGLLDEMNLRLNSILVALTTSRCCLSVAAATWQREFIGACEAAGVHAETSVEPFSNDPELSELQIVAASRLVQETASNIVRHSGATAARLTIRYANAVLNLIVEDDGHAQLENLQHGRGLNGLRTRSSALGGRLEFSAGSMGGLAVHQILPVNSIALDQFQQTATWRPDPESAISYSDDRPASRSA